MIIENDRIILRKLNKRDLPTLKILRDSPIVYRYEPAYLAERQDTPEKALMLLQQMDLDRDRQCILGVYQKTRPDLLVGLAELYDYKPSGKIISIGYRLIDTYWGLGIGSSTVSALVDYIEKETGVLLITAHVIPSNKASAAILLKNGFEHLLTKEEDWGFGHPVTADVYTRDCVRPDPELSRPV